MEILYLAKKTPEILIKIRPKRNFKTPRIESVHLKGTKWSLLISHLTTTAKMSDDDNGAKQYLVQTQTKSAGFLSTTYSRLQVATRGHLWLMLACLVLLIAGGVLLFPQKSWNRLMLKLFGCIHFTVNGHQFKMCEEVPEPQHVQFI
jgi:hypothetical protein